MNYFTTIAVLGLFTFFQSCSSPIDTPASVYIITDETNALQENSPWDNSASRERVEYPLVFLMDAYVKADKLQRKGVDTYSLRDDLSESLLALYEGAYLEFTKKPHPRLLTKILLHHYNYHQGSASESWSEVISKLERLDKKATSSALKQSKNR